LHGHWILLLGNTAIRRWVHHTRNAIADTIYKIEGIGPTAFAPLRAEIFRRVKPGK